MDHAREPGSYSVFPGVNGDGVAYVSGSFFVVSGGRRIGYVRRTAAGRWSATTYAAPPGVEFVLDSPDDVLVDLQLGHHLELSEAVLSIVMAWEHRTGTVRAPGDTQEVKLVPLGAGQLHWAPDAFSPRGEAV